MRRGFCTIVLHYYSIIPLDRYRVSVVHTGDARKLLVTQELVINEVANPSVQLDEDDCYYIFIRLYAPSVRHRFLDKL